ncbi:secreted hydrolase [Leifsonia xyli subsp. cynodontis DSM 46306]|jgi:hypothetical protein|uniref:SGNH hydrolase-type esterase domain-containing protein n=1 Tax=Leifsonia xyli subsp. cynodontis DSM 46306 TaxID=1389489 RepID=U3P6K7_LEIXC|nr:SGNH/GDSL hydrolase family protein [Leifsonia xyli]AGW41416.1 secreted hydrolase [Leifsonia xyli subsp. cynodontis DSM 46306]
MIVGQVVEASDGTKTRLAPQIDALNSSTDVVLVSAGGNDLGFAAILFKCLALAAQGPVPSGSATCSQDFVKDGSDQLASQLTETVKPALDALYEQISERAPHAKKFAFTYPHLLPDPATTPKEGCFRFTTKDGSVVVPFTDVDVAYLHQIQEQLNALIRDESVKYGFTVADASARSEARTACSIAATLGERIRRSGRDRP